MNFNQKKKYYFIALLILFLLIKIFDIIANNKINELEQQKSFYQNRISEIDKQVISVNRITDNYKTAKPRLPDYKSILLQILEKFLDIQINNITTYKEISNLFIELEKSDTVITLNYLNKIKNKFSLYQKKLITRYNNLALSLTSLHQRTKYFHIFQILIISLALLYIFSNLNPDLVNKNKFKKGKLFLKIVNSLPFGLSIWNKNRKNIYYNKKWYEFYQKTNSKSPKKQKLQKADFKMIHNYLGTHYHKVRKIFAEQENKMLLDLEIYNKKSSLKVDNYFYNINYNNNRMVVSLIDEDSHKIKEINKLRELNHEYKEFFRKSELGHFVLDQNYMILDINENGENLLNLNKKEAVGQNFNNFIKKDNLEKLSISKFKNNQPKELFLIQANKSEISVRLIKKEIKINNKRYFLVSVQDIYQKIHNSNVKRVIFKIAEAANISTDLSELFSRIHSLLSEIIDTTNFYIALYDKKSNIIRAPYYVDETKNKVPPPQKLGIGLTAYVIRSGQSMYLTVNKRNELIKKGIIPDADWKSKIWLGVPLKTKKGCIGAMAVQSYNDPNHYSKKDLKILEFVSQQIAISIEKQKAQESLKISEKNLRQFIESATDGILIFDKDLDLIEINQKALQLISMQKNIRYLIGQNIGKVLAYFDIDMDLEPFVKTLKTGNPYTTDYTRFNTSFEAHSINLRAFKVGKNLGMIIHDITDRKEIENKIKTSLKEKEILLKEIHHRVKNNFQIVLSLLNLQKSYIQNDDFLDLFRESQNRVFSMSLIHEKLYKSNNLLKIDFNKYVKELIRHLYIVYRVSYNKIKFLVDINEVFLKLTYAIPCGLIINEIVSSSLKYSLADIENGDLKVKLDITDDKEVVLEIKDNGNGILTVSDNPDENKLSLKLVETMSNQINGNFEIKDDNGTNFALKFANK